MKLYLVNAENIYFPQIKEYFREIVSSYDNGNYRSAMVMLYSTIVCDLLLKLKELTDVYLDQKAEKILEDINGKRKNANSSEWEKSLIDRVHKETELLSDESYALISHIYSWRNFSAHPALNEDYELISPSQEMTIAHIKKALDDILTKPSVFADNIVDRMSDDIDQKRELYKHDFKGFEAYLRRVYFNRMSEKMTQNVFKAFWKFTFRKPEGDIFNKNRYINRLALEAMLNNYYEPICNYIQNNQSYFTIAQDESCLRHVCIMLAFYPKVYNVLNKDAQYQISHIDTDEDFHAIMWFLNGSLEDYLLNFTCNSDTISGTVRSILSRLCSEQGVPHVFRKFLIQHYSKSSSYLGTKHRYICAIKPYLSTFDDKDFIAIIEAINKNDQIYCYAKQREMNDEILEYGRDKLPGDFDFSVYPHFRYTELQTDSNDGDDETVQSQSDDTDNGIDWPF